MGLRTLPGGSGARERGNDSEECIMYGDEDQYLLTLLLNSFSEMGLLTRTFS